MASSFCLIASAPFAAASSPDYINAEQMSVRELMRLDTALAVKLARDRVSKQAAAVGQLQSGVPSHGDLKLLAIYGVGSKLLAEVVVAGRPLVYINGKALPVGVTADQNGAGYLMKGISGSCIELERKGKGETLCLPPAGLAAK